MLYLTCTTITSVDLAHYRVSRAKDWVSVDCGTTPYTGLDVKVINTTRERERECVCVCARACACYQKRKLY